MVTALTATTPPLSDSCQQLFSNWDEASLTELGTGELLCATTVDHLDITETPQKIAWGPHYYTLYV